MYAVGVGNAVEDELKEIASEPVGDHYFYTADFKTMNQIAKKLQINTCPGMTGATQKSVTNIMVQKTLIYWTYTYCSHCAGSGGPL